ncbi:hypothetical protein EJ03DRAFT_37903 [Teratosphaeria nubilosa]|uniref:Uncharacterized protein n=1 Tax=Teratosphaeria nubilosa TaxID=161662 RepID=A0A6G1LF81_9PEZI|nr:hypothetical protein EJ03DRAFT_37903 [Teratosphaeria nubilosa]
MPTERMATGSRRYMLPATTYNATDPLSNKDARFRLRDLCDIFTMRFTNFSMLSTLLCLALSSKVLACNTGADCDQKSHEHCMLCPPQAGTCVLGGECVSAPSGCTCQR